MSYLIDVHLTIPIDIRLLYEKVDFRVGELGAQLSHDVSELLGVDCPRSVLVEKLLGFDFFFCGETIPAGITKVAGFHSIGISRMGWQTEPKGKEGAGKHKRGKNTTWRGAWIGIVFVFDCQASVSTLGELKGGYCRLLPALQML